MAKKLLIMLIFVLAVFSSLFLIGCNDKKIDMQPKDIELSAVVRPFHKESEYQAYMGTDATNSIYETVRVDVSWKIINPELSDSNQLWYPPYIIIVPPGNDWAFIGGSADIPLLYGNRTSVEADIKKAIGKDISEREWNKIDKIGTTVQVKSFGQEYVSFSFINSNLRNIKDPQFTFYLLYYDPVFNKGWYKKVVHTANLVGLGLVY